MKKLFIVLAVASLGFASCGAEEAKETPTEEVTTPTDVPAADSTAPVADSTTAPVADSSAH